MAKSGFEFQTKWDEKNMKMLFEATEATANLMATEFLAEAIRLAPVGIYTEEYPRSLWSKKSGPVKGSLRKGMFDKRGIKGAFVRAGAWYAYVLEKGRLVSPIMSDKGVRKHVKAKASAARYAKYPFMIPALNAVRRNLRKILKQAFPEKWI